MNVNHAEIDKNMNKMSEMIQKIGQMIARVSKVVKFPILIYLVAVLNMGIVPTGLGINRHISD